MHKIYILLFAKILRLSLCIYLLHEFFKMQQFASYKDLTLGLQTIVAFIYLTLLSEFYLLYKVLKKQEINHSYIGGGISAIDTTFMSSLLAIISKPSLSVSPLETIKGLLATSVTVQIFGLLHIMYMEYQKLQSLKWTGKVYDDISIYTPVSNTETLKKRFRKKMKSPCDDGSCSLTSDI